MVVWSGLVLLCGFSYLSAGSGGTAWLILTASGVKALILMWNYMELRSAHRIWIGLMGFLIVAILVAVALTGHWSGPAAVS